MKNYLLISNLGTNDFKIPNKLINDVKNDFAIDKFEIDNKGLRKDYYNISKTIYNSLRDNNSLLEKYKKYVSEIFPIYSAYLKKINEDISENFILHNLLINTEQNYMEEGYHNHDTKYVGNLIKLFFNDAQNKIEFYEINENPSNYHICLEKYQKDIRKKINLLVQKKNQIFICPTAGTTALGFGLLLNSFSIKNSQILYVSRDENKARVINIDVNMRRNFIDNYVQTVKGDNKRILDFNTISLFYKDIDEQKKSIIALFLSHFYEYRFNEANKILCNEFDTYGLKEIKMINNNIEPLKKIMRNWKEKENSLKILLMIIEYLFEKESFLDIPLRISSFKEMLILYFIEKKANIDFSDSKKINYIDYMKKLNQTDTGFKIYILQQKTNNGLKKLKKIYGPKVFDFDLNRTSSLTLLLFFIYIIEKKSDFDKENKEYIIDIFLKLDEYLKNIRNKMAHEIAELSDLNKDKIKNFIHDLKKIYEMITKEKYKNLMEPLRKYLNEK